MSVSRLLFRVLSFVRYPFLNMKGVVIHPLSVVGANVEIGKGTNINGQCFIGKDRDVHVSIGRYCAIGHNLRVRLSNHNTQFLNLNYDLQRELGCSLGRIVKGPVTIGNGVWIGDNVTILPGVSIGDGSVIAACSVVAKDVLPYTIIGGVPAKKIKSRFSEEVKAKIESLSWWNWSKSTMISNKIIFENEVSLEALEEVMSVGKK